MTTIVEVRGRLAPPPAGSLGALDKLPVLLRPEAGPFPWVMLSADSRRLLAWAGRQALDAMRAAARRGTHLHTMAQHAQQTHQQAWTNAVAKLLRENVETERQVRTLAWALDHASHGIPVVVSAPTDRAVDSIVARSGGFTVVWWAAEAAVPTALAQTAGRGYTLLATGGDRYLQPRPGAVVLSDNAALIERGDGLGGTTTLELRGAAAVIQALCHPHTSDAWIPVRAPHHFRRLRHDIRFSEAQTRLEAGLVEPVVTRPQGPLAISHMGLRNLYPRSLNGTWVAAMAASRRIPMPENNVRSKPLVIFREEPGENADPQAHPHVVIFSDLPGMDQPPDGKPLFNIEYRADSLRELLGQIEVPIEGTVIDPDGNSMHVRGRCTSVESFDESGLTQIPELFTWYVRARVYDTLCRRDARPLGPAEYEKLESQIALMEKSLLGEQS